MKLITYKNNYLILLYLTAFFILGFFFYYIIKFFLDEDNQEKLNDRKAYVVRQLESSDSILTYQKLSRNTFEIRLTPPGKSITDFPVYKDTVITNSYDGKEISYRQMKFYFTPSRNNKTYEINVRRAKAEWEEIVEAVVTMMSIFFVLLLVSIFLLQQWISQQTWKPFYQLLNRMQQYNIGKLHKLDMPDTHIKEFKELQNILDKMIEQLYKDYVVLKEFTENVSHEIQTPLAVIKAKLELISHSPGINEDQLTLIDTCFNSINRLSKLYEALVLLARIENGQYTGNDVVELTTVINNKLELYKDLIEMKEISVEVNVMGKPVKQINYMLADILIGNLIINAIRHNIIGGTLRIDQLDNKIVITNSGEELTTDPENLFKRFSKVNSTSLGLGLAIVKQICDTNTISVSYTHHNQSHTITLLF